MRAFKTILAVMLIAALMLSLASCSGGIKGKWEVTDGGDEGTIWEFNSDGTVYLYEEGDGEDDYIEYKYEVNGKKISIDLGSETVTGSFKISGKKLTISIKGEDDKLVLERK